MAVRHGLCLCLLFATTALAQSRPPAPSLEKATVHAFRVPSSESINVDGRLDEVVWQTAEPAADFKQSDPRNGADATERTEVRIVYDNDHLYIGAQFFDSDPN